MRYIIVIINPLSLLKPEIMYNNCIFEKITLHEVKNRERNPGSNH